MCHTSEVWHIQVVADGLFNDVGVDFFYDSASFVCDVFYSVAGEPLAEGFGVGGVVAGYEFFGGGDYEEADAAEELDEFVCRMWEAWEPLPRPLSKGEGRCCVCASGGLTPSLSNWRGRCCAGGGVVLLNCFGVHDG